MLSYINITYTMLCYMCCTCYVTCVVLCSITCVMLCYITYVMLCYMTYVQNRTCYITCVMLCYITYVMLCYITYVIIFLEFHSTKQGLPLVDSWSRGLD